MHRSTGARFLGIVFFLAAAAASLKSDTQASEPPFEWNHQFDYSGLDEFSQGISADSLGHVFVMGQRFLSEFRQRAFISNYSPAGDFVWTRQLEVEAREVAPAISADGLGNLYISGSHAIDLAGPPSSSWDVYVRKFDGSGNIIWTRQLGSSQIDDSAGVSADALGNVFIAGMTEGSLGAPSAGGGDAFVAKYDPAGNLQWARQLGTAQRDFGSGLAADGVGNVYISGYTKGSLASDNPEGHDEFFVAKYDALGNQIWVRQLWTHRGDGNNAGVAVDRLGNVYIATTTYTDQQDVILLKYDANGNLLWTRQAGSDRYDSVGGISVDPFGGVYIAGRTDGDFGGVSAGEEDAFLLNYSADGELLWNHQFGTKDSEEFSGVSTNSVGNAYVVGFTLDRLWDTHKGPDLLLAKIATVPEPSAGVLAAAAAAALLVVTLRRRMAPAANYIRSAHSSIQRQVSSTCWNASATSLPFVPAAMMR